jgi:isopenicillin-N epimerase
MLEPLVVSHGWDTPNPGPSQFLDYFTWVGTMDPAAYLSVPKAIEFQEQHDWAQVRAACHALAKEAENRLLELSDADPISPESMWMQLRSIPIPGKGEDYKEMWDRHKIVIPIFDWNGHTFARISIQAYNKPADVERLVQAVADISAGK